MPHSIGAKKRRDERRMWEYRMKYAIDTLIHLCRLPHGTSTAFSVEYDEFLHPIRMEAFRRGFIFWFGEDPLTNGRKVRVWHISLSEFIRLAKEYYNIDLSSWEGIDG